MHLIGAVSSFAPLGLGVLALNFFGRSFFRHEASPLAIINIMATLVAAVFFHAWASFTLMRYAFQAALIRAQSDLIRPNPT